MYLRDELGPASAPVLKETRLSHALTAPATCTSTSSASAPCPPRPAAQRRERIAGQGGSGRDHRIAAAAKLSAGVFEAVSGATRSIRIDARSSRVESVLEESVWHEIQEPEAVIRADQHQGLEP